MKIHYIHRGRLMCQTSAAMPSTTRKVAEVTCKVCLFHMGLHKPVGYDPDRIRKENAEIIRKAGQNAIASLIRGLVLSCHRMPYVLH